MFAPDPSYFMEPVPVVLSEALTNIIEGKAVGLNLSPLLARYLANGDLNSWIRKASDFVAGLIDQLQMGVILIPHVTSDRGERMVDDELFLQSVCRNMPQALCNRVALAPHGLTSPQIKWLISQVHVFIGARTHSTLAAFATGVPCVSIAYSQKAFGINQWIFGDTRWVEDAKHFDPQSLINKTAMLVNNRQDVSNFLLSVSSKAKDDMKNIGKTIKRSIAQHKR